MATTANIKKTASTPPPLPSKTSALTAPLEIEIIRGSKGERVCYAPDRGSMNCSGASETADPGPPAAMPDKPHLMGPGS